MSPLIDSYDRRIEYLRVSVTDRCNYRCFYCIPGAGMTWQSRREFLTTAELGRLLRLFAELGVSRVRLTGGEPLVRDDLPQLISAMAASSGIEDISLSSNGHLLPGKARVLRQAGLQRVNISLDSLRPETFRRITGNGDLDSVLRGIDAAIEAGFSPVKLNMVVMTGINDDEIEDMFEYARQRGADLRFIETMPIGQAGLQGTDHFISAETILRRLKEHAGDELVPARARRGGGPARYYQVGASRVHVGVISALSRHFCDDCNRVRLTARGDLVLCLGQQDRVSLREPLRAGVDDRGLREIILQAIASKPRRHDFSVDASSVPLRQMSALGG